jgi:hypothetical protein
MYLLFWDTYRQNDSSIISVTPSHSSHFTPVKELHWIRDWMRPRAGTDVLEKTEIPYSYRHLNPGPHSPLSSCCTDWAIPDPSIKCVECNSKQDRQCTCNGIYRRVRETTVAIEKRARVCVCVCVCVCVRVSVGGWMGRCTGVGVCFLACSLTNPACNAPPYCHLWPPWLHHTFRLYLTNGTIFGKKVNERKMCVVIFPTIFVWNISLTKKKKDRRCMWNVTLRRVHEPSLSYKSNTSYIFLCVCVTACACMRACVGGWVWVHERWGVLASV